MSNINFIGALRQTALANFMALNSNNLSRALQSPILRQFASLQSSFSVGASQLSAVSGLALRPGFLNPPPAVSNKTFSSHTVAFILSKNTIVSDILKGGSISLPKNIAGAVTPLLNSISSMMATLLSGLQFNNALSSLNPTSSVNTAPLSLSQLPGFTQIGVTPPSFPPVPPTDFLNTLPRNNIYAVAKQLNAAGRWNIKIANQLVNKLRNLQVEILPASSKESDSLALSPQEVQSILSAPTVEEAKDILYSAISKRTGIPIKNFDMKNRILIRSPRARKVLNKLLGWNLKNGIEKNSMASLILDSIVEAAVKTLRNGSFGTTLFRLPEGKSFSQLASEIGNSMKGEIAYILAILLTTQKLANKSELEVKNPSKGVKIKLPKKKKKSTRKKNLGIEWRKPKFLGSQANEGVGVVGGRVGVFGSQVNEGVGIVGKGPGSFGRFEQGFQAEGAGVTFGGDGDSALDDPPDSVSPLIFDLEGTGLELKNPEMIEVDIDNDGKPELITDIDAELGLLVFDSKEDGLDEITGADMFGDNTDLSHYGITAPTPDGRFRDGFQALRALCEHYGLVNENKQYLDENDLAFLEEEVGLRMRVGGIVDGEDRRFREVGITRINLGNPEQTQHLEDIPEDKWGNKLMFQDGSTFIVYGDEREYADIWFKIQARRYEGLFGIDLPDPDDQTPQLSKVQLVFSR